jgi:CheY-like chemotaxis protein
MSFGPLHILLVDDNHDTAMVVARLLQRDGHFVTAAEGYRTALDAAKTQQFDLLVADIGLPDGDGLELLHELRTLYPIRGVVISGYAAIEDIDRSAAAGFSRYIAKPFSYAALKDAIAEVAGNKNGETNPEQTEWGMDSI